MEISVEAIRPDDRAFTAAIFCDLVLASHPLRCGAVLQVADWGCVQLFTVRSQWREGWLLNGHQDAPFPHQDVVIGSLLSIVLGLMSLVCDPAPNLAGFTPNIHCHTCLDGGLQKYEITKYDASVSQKCTIDGQV